MTEEDTWSFDFYGDAKNTVYAPEGWHGGLKRVRETRSAPGRSTCGSTGPAAGWGWGADMTEYRRILLDGACVQVMRDGDELVAGDGRRVAVAEAAHLPPCCADQDRGGAPETIPAGSRSSAPGCPAAPNLLPTSRSRALVGHGGAVVRPAGCQLPETTRARVAVVIGRLVPGGSPRRRPGSTSRVTTVANDFGLHDFRDNRRRVDASGEGLRHDGAARPGAGHRLGLPRQAAAHLRQRQPWCRTGPPTR